MGSPPSSPSRSRRRRGGGGEGGALSSTAPSPAWKASSGGASRELCAARTVEKAEVICRACFTHCPFLSKVCPTCESAPSFSVSGNFNLKGALRVLHDGRGGGASNLVLVGWDRDCHRKVVVKAARLAEDPEEAATLHEEIQLQRRFNHPNLVPLVYAAETPSEVLIVTPFAAGGDLHAAMGVNGSLSELQARNFCSQMLQAFRYMHERHSILHGDVKPRNVFLLPRGEGPDGGSGTSPGGAFVAQLGDFGLSREVPREAPYKCTFHGLQGTHGFMASELLARQDYGFPVDLFALGVILFTYIGGYEPFYPASNVEAPLEFDPSCWGHLSDQCAAFVASLLRVNPDDRPSTRQASEDDWFRPDTRVWDASSLPDGVCPPVDIHFLPASEVAPDTKSD